MNAMRGWAGGIAAIVGIVTVVALGIALGDRFRSNSYLFVDNAGDLPATVTIEGEEGITVAPRSVGVVYARHGEKNIRVERGGQAIFEKQVSLESPGFYAVRKYVVNPRQESGYWVDRIVYGTNIQIPPVNIGMTPYAGIAQQTPLVSKEEWFLVPQDKSEYVLTENPPEKLEMDKNQLSVTKYQLCRMERREYDLIEAAPLKQNPTEQETEEMAAMVKRILQEAARPK